MEDKPIQRLSDELIGKIAAGEVVENPASAIKEMVENSLDSGATAITVEIRDGGISFIRVTDNGKGIRSREIRMAFERHATSKIATTQDLFNLGTLGFRGEALASIAAVSKMTLTTHRAGEAVGTRAINEGGQIKEITEAAAPQGTTIVVRDLFFNTPVRLKFLKKATTEASKVAEVIQRLILSRPDIAIRLISNGRQIYSSSGNGELRSAVFCLYGRETAENMVKVHAEGSISVDGLIGVGQEARANRNRQTFIINGRCIRSTLLSQALEDGARERFTIGHYPVCVINLTMPSTLVDVNVHPNKLEVRFSDENLVYQKLSSAVHDAFSISPLSGAPEMKTPDSRPDPLPIQVIQTGSEAGLSQAVKIIQTPTSEDAPVPERSAPPVSPSVPISTKPAVTTKPADAREPEPGLQDNDNFASVVSNYFAGNFHPETVQGTREAPEVSEPSDTDEDARTASEIVSAKPDQPVETAVPDRPAEQPVQLAAANTATESPERNVSFEPSAGRPADPLYRTIPERKWSDDDGQTKELRAMDPPAPEPEQTRFLEPVAPEEDAFAGYELIGTAFDTYILLQNKKQILLIDQHAAHERILYEKLMKAVDTGAGSQMLLVPQIVHVTPQDAVKIETYREEITAAGYEIEPFGESDYQIRAVPYVLGQPETREAFLELIDRLGELRVLSTRQKRRDAILQMACKKAIKGGDKLELSEIKSLLKEMQQTGAPPTCPHGRPLVVILSKTEIEKKFRRIND